MRCPRDCRSVVWVVNVRPFRDWFPDLTGPTTFICIGVEGGRGNTSGCRPSICNIFVGGWIADQSPTGVPKSIMRIPDIEAVHWTEGVGVTDNASPAGVRQTLEQGFAVIRQLIPPTLISAVARDVGIACAELGWIQPGDDPFLARPGLRLRGRGYDDPDWIELQQRVFGGGAIVELRRHHTLVTTVERLLGASPRVAQGDICRVVFPNVPEHTTRAHQDLSYLPEPCHLWTVWIPLVACSKQAGPLAVIPKSRRGGLRRHLGPGGRDGALVEDNERWVSAVFEIGDVMVFHGETVHAALHNTQQSRLRVSVDLRYSSPP